MYVILCSNLFCWLTKYCLLSLESIMEVHGEKNEDEGLGGRLLIFFCFRCMHAFNYWVFNIEDVFTPLIPALMHYNYVITLFMCVSPAVVSCHILTVWLADDPIWWTAVSMVTVTKTWKPPRSFSARVMSITSSHCRGWGEKGKRVKYVWQTAFGLQKSIFR